MPAVLGYNILLRRNKAILEKTGYFSHDLQQALLAGSRVGASEQPAATGEKSRLVIAQSVDVQGLEPSNVNSRAESNIFAFVTQRHRVDAVMRSKKFRV